jgi:hypothetical protein
MVSRPVYLGVRHPSGTRDQFFSFSLFFFFFLNSYVFVDVGRPLWWEVGSVVFSLLGISSAAFLRSESHGTHEHILLLLFLRLSQLGGPGSCIYFFHEQGSPVIPPGHWVLIGLKLKLKSIYDRRSEASLSWCRTPICSTWPDFFFGLTIAGFFMWGTLSDESMGL